MISVQCQTQFSKDIWAKYSWSFSQGNHVRLQHKEDVVHAKQAPPAMPKVTIQQIIQPLHIKLALQHLSFSQLAVYKQQLLRETNDGITRLQASQGAQGAQGVQGTQVAQGVQGTQVVQGAQGTQGAQGVQGSQGVQGTQGVQDAQAAQALQGAQSLLLRHGQAVKLVNGHAPNVRTYDAQEEQRSRAWLQMKHVSQHFKQDRFLQSIMDKRSSAIQYDQHLRHIDNVVAQAQALDIDDVYDRVTLEQTTVPISDLKKENAKPQLAEAQLSQAIITSHTQQLAPARMIWHERVEERLQQWKAEQEASLLKSETIVKHNEQQTNLIVKKASEKQGSIPSEEIIVNESLTVPLAERVIQTSVQRLVQRDLMSYMASQHMNVSTTQMIQLKKIKSKNVTQKVLKRIEQRLSNEHITLHYAEHTVKRKRGRPKKENNQLDNEQQAVTQHIHRNRKMASVLKIVEVQANPAYSETTTTQAERIQVKVEPSANAQLSNVSIGKSLVIQPDDSIKHSDQHHVQLSNLTKRRIISVSELWLTSIKSKEQLQSLSLIHLTKQSSNHTKQSDGVSNQSSDSTKQSNTITQQNNAATQQRNTATQQRNAATEQSDVATQQRNATTGQSDVATQQRNTATEQSMGSMQSSIQASGRPIVAGDALGDPATVQTRDEIELQRQSQLEVEKLAEAHTLQIVNRQLQAKVEHVHIHSRRWLQHSITKHKRAMSAPEVQADQLINSNEGIKPLLQAKWQHKLAS